MFNFWIVPKENNFALNANNFNFFKTTFKTPYKVYSTISIIKVITFQEIDVLIIHSFI